MSSQRDAERADIEQERLEQLKGPAAQVGTLRTRRAQFAQTTCTYKLHTRVRCLLAVLVSMAVA